MTHSDLVKVAEKWLYKSCGCGVVLTELVSYTDEIPDAIGFRSFYSILVECKTSRSDFFADAKKLFRQNSEIGMGDYRFFLCETGLILPEELPNKWGLLYHKDNKVIKVKAPKGNIWSGAWNEQFRFQKNKDAEYKIMFSALRRVNLRGDLHKIYDKPLPLSQGSVNNQLTIKELQ